jgi:hypothetical protein
VDSDVTDAVVLEGHIDSVFVIDTAAGKHVLAVEAQTSEDEKKRRAWPFYIAALRKKHDAEVPLLVVCPDLATAKWARKPIKIGLAGRPSQVTYPLVLGPDNCPAVVTREDALADVRLAVLSAATHRFSPQVEQILNVLADVLDSIDPATGADLAELTAVGLSESAAQEIWRELMGTKFKTRTFFDDWRDEARAEGLAEGRAEGLATGHAEGRAEGHEQGRAEGETRGEATALLAVLTAREVDVSDAAREEITSCTDTGQLATWIQRAATATSIDDVLR